MGVDISKMTPVISFGNFRPSGAPENLKIEIFEKFFSDSNSNDFQSQKFL